jgi:hypothetical protein
MIRSVAVLGAGIMGSSTALHLARRGVAVTLFDEASEPFTGASRWNEGKIHLGFLYAADSSLRTARAVVMGGLDFKQQVERLTGMALGAATSTMDDLYLVHRDSVVAPAAVGAYLDRVAAMVAASPAAHGYLVDVSDCAVQRLGAADLEAVSDTSVIVAGYRVPERSVDTTMVADAFVGALRSDARIAMAMDHAVVAVRAGERDREQWFVHTSDARCGPFDAVVNALWHGRPAVDETIGHRPDSEHQHRYRVSVFARTRHVVDAPCAVISVGPFGDVKNYNGRNFYLSWYPLGLLARSESVEAPAVPGLADAARQDLVRRVFAALTARLPWVAAIEAATTDARVEGGWVYSQGGGLLDDPAATVHQRSRLGITNVGTYYSVDTGKYSVAPTLAERLARAITGDS